MALRFCSTLQACFLRYFKTLLIAGFDAEEHVRYVHALKEFPRSSSVISFGRTLQLKVIFCEDRPINDKLDLFLTARGVAKNIVIDGKLRHVEPFDFIGHFFHNVLRGKEPRLRALVEVPFQWV